MLGEKRDVDIEMPGALETTDIELQAWGHLRVFCSLLIPATHGRHGSWVWDVALLSLGRLKAQVGEHSII